MTALIETALAAIATRLAAQIPGVPIDRARRAEVNLNTEPLPRLRLEAIEWAADETIEPLVVHYTLSFAVGGYVRAADGLQAAAADLSAWQRATELQAQVVAALSGWTPAEPGLGDAAQDGTDINLADADDSKIAAAEFTARFTMLCLGPLIAA